MSRAFTRVNAQLQKLKEADFDLSDSDNEDEASNFQMAQINFCTSDFQLAQFYKEFEPRIASLFNQTAGSNTGIKTKLDLRGVILLDSQSTVDLFCNLYLVEKNTKSKI